MGYFVQTNSLVPQELAAQVREYTGHNWWNVRALFECMRGSTKAQVDVAMLEAMSDKSEPPAHLIAELQKYTNAPWWLDHPDLKAALQSAKATARKA